MKRKSLDQCGRKTNIRERYFIIVDGKALNFVLIKVWNREQQKINLGACQQMLSHIARIGGIRFRLISVRSIPLGEYHYHAK